MASSCDYHDVSADDRVRIAAACREAVAKGIAWLDVNKPGWLTKIALDTLDLSEPCGCIRGQLDEDWRRTIYPYSDETRSQHAARGFVLPAGMSVFRYDLQLGWAILTAEWKHQITEKREALASAS